MHVVALALLWASAAEAGKKKDRTVEVPIDIGVGPAAHLITGPVYQDQPVMGGIVVSAAAIIDKKTLKKFRGRIPAQYRDLAKSLDEVRISHPLIPDTLWISPAVAGSTTGMYGISFRPLSVGLRPFPALSLGTGLRLSYAYLHSTTIDSPTHFLRPGLDLKGEIEIPFSKTFLVDLGWTSQFYIPQGVGGPVFEVPPLDESIWHIGQAYVEFHFRFMKEVKL